MDILRNYRLLVQKNDELCSAIAYAWGAHLACRRGCDGCCRHLELFPVEAHALAEALRSAPPQLRERLREKAAVAGEECPLLENGECLLYEARPLICRTHGYPLLISGEGGRRVDFCPLNFRGVDSLPGSALIDLERLNEMLTAVNALFLQESGEDRHERRSLAQVILTTTFDPSTCALSLEP